MNINLKTCRVCGRIFDFKDCPYCRLIKFNKKIWLDQLFYDVGKQQYDFKLCGLKKMSDGSTKATKWKKYSEVCFDFEPWETWKIQWVNNRQILPNEIVIDIEDKDRENLIRICEKLEEKGLVFTVYDTGSKGYHIHIFSSEELTKEDKLRWVRGFKADELKVHESTMIALENTPHWKTGKLKEEIGWRKK